MPTTQQVVAAVQAAPYRSYELPIEATLSLPIPLLIEGRVVLAFFWCSYGGPIQNRTISTPYCHTLADPEHLEDITFQSIQPRDLGIDLPQVASLGKPTIGGRVLHAEIGQVWDDFYRATDRIMALYERAATTPGAFPDEDELAEIGTYRDLFHRIAIVALLPAYRALSPHFFAWMDAVLGPQSGR